AAESPDHAAFDHHGALRALFAGDHARSNPRSGAALLLHLDQHIVERQPHQCSRNFSLLLLIVGDADSPKNGLVERRRIAPDAPRSIFGIPVFTHWGPSFGAAYLGSVMLHCNM